MTDRAEKRVSPQSGFAAVGGATIAFSLVGIVAGWLALDTATMVAGRAVFALAAITVYRLLHRQPLLPPVPRDQILWLLVACAGLCGNWYFLFLSIRLSSVSIAVFALFTHPLLTALLEPLLLRTRLNAITLSASSVVPIGIIVLLPDWAPGDSTVQGVAAGVASALFLAFANVANKRLVPRAGYGPLLVYPFLVATLVFGLSLVLVAGELKLIDWFGLVGLGAILTSTAQILLLAGFKQLPASTAALLLTLQPVVTVVLAGAILAERPDARTLIGGALILLPVTVVAGRARRLSTGEAGR